MKTMDVSTESLARRIAVGLRKVSMAIRSRAWKEAGARRITPLQSQALTVLRTQPGEAATVSTLAEELAVSLPTVSDMVKTLERKGLARKTRSHDDARIVTVRLSSKGRRLAEGGKGRRDALGAVADQLPVAEQKMLLPALLKIVHILHLRGDVPAVRMCLTCRFFQPHAHKDARRPHHCAFFKEAFGNRLLRIECDKHEAATKASNDRNWHVFTAHRT